MTQTPRARHWCFTLNNPTVSKEEYLQGTPYDYLVIGDEIGENGTPHLQGYVVWHEKQRLSALKKYGATTHWEIARATPVQASDYCKKEGSYYEDGELPRTAGESQIQKWKHIHELARAQDMPTFMDAYPDVAFLHQEKFKNLVTYYQTPAAPIDELNHEWFVGPAGSGKSSTARRLYPQAYIKPTATKWWPDYAGQEVVIVDDVDDTHEYVLVWLKNWADHYPFYAETKGGHTKMIRPKKFIVTSQYEIWEITQKTQLREAITRRFKRVSFPHNETEEDALIPEPLIFDGSVQFEHDMFAEYV